MQLLDEVVDALERRETLLDNVDLAQRHARALLDNHLLLLLDGRVGDKHLHGLALARRVASPSGRRVTI